jgi:KDO2-lipid IV(A) lauroyltransferase
VSAARASAFQRARAALLAGASWAAVRLPEGPLTRLAEWAGLAWYRLAPARAAQARRNLRRVSRALTDGGTAPPYVRAAVSDPRALERLVKLAFRHNARYYLEVARAPGMGPKSVERRLLLETPELLAEAFGSGRALIFAGLHFGDLEVPARYLAARTGRAVAPMETLPDPALQGWFERTRGASGIRIVGLREARRELLEALRDGDSVGLVGDRDLTGGGTLVQLFGAPARLPLGPALLAIESGAPLFAVGVRRAGIGRYRGRVEPIAVPLEGTRRERVTATTNGLARAFERIIADAPEQWWAVFFPIWPDLEAAGAPAPRAPDEPRPALEPGGEPGRRTA